MKAYDHDIPASHSDLKKMPYRVPEGYFDDFAKKLMAHLPMEESTMMESESAEPRITPWQHIKPWIYMAAMFCDIMLSVRIFVGEPQKDKFPITQAEAEMLPDDEWEIMVRRTLMDDYELYEYLTENK